MYLSPLWSLYVGFPSVIDASLYLVAAYTNTVLLMNFQGVIILQTKVASPVNCVSANKYILIGTSNSFYLMSWDGKMLFIRDIPTYFCSTWGDYVAIASDQVILTYKVYNDNLVFLNMFPSSSPISLWKDKLAYLDNGELIIATVYGDQLESFNVTEGIKSLALINDTVYACGHGIYAFGKYNAHLDAICNNIDANKYIVASTSEGILLLSPKLRVLAKFDIPAFSVSTFGDYVFASTSASIHAFYILFKQVDILRGASLLIILLIIAKWLWDRRPTKVPPLPTLLRD